MLFVIPFSTSVTTLRRVLVRKDRKEGRHIGGFEDEGDLEKKRKSVRGQGIIATRREDRADARDWTHNIIIFGYLQ